MNYYQKKIFIPQLNKRGEIIGKIERWQAHQKGILHRAFTVIVYFKDKIICQHRKHPVFDGYLDFTVSSHPVYINNRLQTDKKAILNTLKREWNIKKEALVLPIKLEKKIIYQSSDGHYTENEHCYFYSTRVDKMPVFNDKFAYGYSLLTPTQIKLLPSLNSIIAPWVREFFRKK